MPKACLYINLDRAIERRRSLEQSFAAAQQDEWRLERIAAIDGDRLSPPPPGRLRASEIACIQSHCLALERAAALPEPSLIVEDDCLFHPQSLALLDQLWRSSTDTVTKLLFAEVCVPNPDDMVKLFLLRRSLGRTHEHGFQGRLQTVDLRRINFVAASAYMVGPEVAAGLARTFRAMPHHDLPYDIVLRRLVHSGQLRADVAFPFLTTIARLGDESTIQPDREKLTDASWNSFRRMMWVGAVSDDTASRRRRQLPATFVDERTAAFTDLLAVCLSPDFLHK